jgi:hypothetical protein
MSRAQLRNTVLALLGLEAALVALDLAVSYSRLVEYVPLRHLLDVTREGSVGNWFSSSQTLIAALVLGLIVWRVRREDRSRWRAAGWGLLALFFLYMAVDDAAMIHERLGSYMEWLAQRAPDDHRLFARLHQRQGSYSWQILLAPVFGGMGLFMLAFLWRELREWTPRLLVVMGIACLAMAVGLDHVEGTNGGYLNVARWLTVSPLVVQHLGMVLEELAEMFGTTMLLAAFLQHLLRGARLQLDGESQSADQVKSC